MRWCDVIRGDDVMWYNDVMRCDDVMWCDAMRWCDVMRGDDVMWCDAMMWCDVMCVYVIDVMWCDVIVVAAVVCICTWYVFSVLFADWVGHQLRIMARLQEQQEPEHPGPKALHGQVALFNLGRA
jgi:hypothetical protein